jgi:hypothetical protein
MIGAVTSLRAAGAARAGGDGTANGNGKSLPVVQEKTSDSPFCHACWSGEYPIEFTHHPRVRQMRLMDL